MAPDAGPDDALLFDLANVERRREAAARIARACGADQVYAFVADPAHSRRLVPAPGFAPTIAGGAGWRTLLAHCAAPGVHVGEVAHPTPSQQVPAVALASDGMALVAVGVGREAADPLAATVGAALPVVARMLQVEVETVALRARLKVAEEVAARGAELTRALDEARGEAEAAARVKDEFLAMLGHELRNPLAPIVTALHLLRATGSGSRELAVIDRQVTHLMRLVDDLLDVSRITRGKVELRPERVELSTIVARSAEMVRPLVAARGHELEVSVPETGLEIDGDPARLAQVVSNLLTNAAKYSEDGKRITVVGTSRGGRIVLEVADEGIGLTPDVLQSVFQPFFQTPQGLDRARGGLGLGLAIVHSLVRLHGGTIEAHSEGLGRGSRFVIELPRAAPGARAVRPVPIEPLPVAPRRERPVRVLVVDDNEDAGELLLFALTHAGFEAECATTGAAALAQVEAFSPDVALLDIGLPDIDGYELARRVRERGRPMVLVALTGYGQESDKAKAREAGFDAHLVKPVDPDQVRRTILSAIAAGAS